MGFNMTNPGLIETLAFMRMSPSLGREEGGASQERGEWQSWLQRMYDDCHCEDFSDEASNVLDYYRQDCQVVSQSVAYAACALL